MNIHNNARLTPLGRERLVRMMLRRGKHRRPPHGRQAFARARRASGSPRVKAEGLTGLRDRSSRPHRLRRPTPVTSVDRIIALRRQRWTGKHIARTLAVSPATVSRVLKRAGISRLKDLEPGEPVRRY